MAKTTAAADAKRSRELLLAYKQLRKAADRVLSDVDDDGVAEAHDVAIYELRNALKRVTTLTNGRISV